MISNTHLYEEPLDVNGNKLGKGSKSSGGIPAYEFISSTVDQ